METTETIVILHGWQSSKEKWQETRQILAGLLDGAKIIIPDIPGFKPETELKSPWDLDDYIKWFNQFLMDKHIKDGFFLLGHSFGGRMAIKFAEKYPNRLKGLILVSAAGIKDKSFRKDILLKGAKLVRKLRIKDAPFLGGVWQFIRKFFYIYILRTTDYLKTSGALKQTIKNVLSEDLTPLLNRISIPVFIIWGDKDKLTPIKHGLLMRDLIKNSKLKILQGIGHTPYLENPRILAEEIAKFIKQKGVI